jgi:hypothetical protein
MVQNMLPLKKGMKMALTRDFRETVQADAKRDPAFRRGLLSDALESLLSGEVTLGKELLRDYINATVGQTGIRPPTTCLRSLRIYSRRKVYASKCAPHGPPCAPSVDGPLREENARLLPL